jgi:hypothetical protein
MTQTNTTHETTADQVSRRPDPTQIAAAVQALSTAPITNRRILAVLADCLPAGYTISLQRAKHRGVDLAWHAAGTPNADFSLWEPVVKGQGRQIITRLATAAWDHAEQDGSPVRTRAEQAAWVKANPMPVCPGCGRTVLPAESAISSHHGWHSDCC